MTNTHESLQERLNSIPHLVNYLSNNVSAGHSSKASGTQPIPEAFTNWRDEQAAQSEAAVLLHQTYNMPSLFVKGPAAIELLKAIAVNTFENYSLDRGKQFVACAPSGYLIGDCILYRHGESSFELVSSPSVQNWVEYVAKAERYDVDLLRDNAFNTNPTGRRVRYRFELLGPNARKVFDKVLDEEIPEIGVFRQRMVRINDHEVLLLRHGMVGAFAIELSGPFEEQDAVRDYILEAGKEFGLKPMGMAAYYSNVHSGWMAYPVPATFTDPEMLDFRRWLPAQTFEMGHELGGSFTSDKISDYYMSPYDVGYAGIIKFDHDFYGRDALQKIPNEAKRRKVTLVWDTADVLRVMRSQFGSGPRFKAINFPVVNYAWSQHDEVRSMKGDFIGVSRHAAYLNPLGAIISLAVLSAEAATIGEEVTITWGEPNGGSLKPQVERHEQTTIRARIAQTPYDPGTHARLVAKT